MKLLELICENFKSFRDEYEWPQEARVRVRFLKRAQILVADVWSCFASFPQTQSTQFEELRALTAFPDVRELTCFADYRVPQALAFFGVLQYSSGLLERLRACTCTHNALVRVHCKCSTVSPQHLVCSSASHLLCVPPQSSASPPAVARSSSCAAARSPRSSSCATR